MASQQVNGDGLPIFNKFFMENADNSNNVSVAEAVGSAATENAIAHTGLNAESRSSISAFTPQMEHRNFQTTSRNSLLVHNGLFFELRHQTAACAPLMGIVGTSGEPRPLVIEQEIDQDLIWENLAAIPSTGVNLPPTLITDAGSSAGILSKFAPVTPDQNIRAKKEKHMEYYMPNLCLRETVKDMVGLSKVPVRCDFDEHQNKQQSQLVEDQSYATKSPILRENQKIEKCSDQLSDLGKTPQQIPRKRVYKPNVTDECQPKGTANPRIAEPTGFQRVTTPERKCVRESRVSKPEYTPLGGTPDNIELYIQSRVSVGMLKSKRNYETMNGMNQPTTPLEEGVNGATDSQVTQATQRSCKRSLNFEFESQVAGRSTIQPFSDANVNPNAKIASACGQSITTMNLGQGMNAMIDKTTVSTSHDLTQFMSHTLESCLPIKTQLPCPSTSFKIEQLKEEPVSAIQMHPAEENVK